MKLQTFWLAFGVIVGTFHSDLADAPPPCKLRQQTLSCFVARGA
jgi:hypothetical protein